jgi:hypothetical protein
MTEPKKGPSCTSQQMEELMRSAAWRVIDWALAKRATHDTIQVMSNLDPERQTDGLVEKGRVAEIGVIRELPRMIVAQLKAKEEAEAKTPGAAS